MRTNVGNINFQPTLNFSSKLVWITLIFLRKINVGHLFYLVLLLSYNYY